ncbi:hypothetical protein EVC03_096 [Rhizobium phage RHph_Y5A]|nr:hypothetical protein EVC03_096 [Rhizobium phage RHph_Y5A]QIG75538.1 hypothetical protein EVC18_096 [Rhizobium phage RHph_Y2_4]
MFYVTIIRGKRVGFLLGPYPTHDQALSNVDRGKSLACAADPWADFDAFGTCKLKDENNPPKAIFGH